MYGYTENAIPQDKLPNRVPKLPYRTPLEPGTSSSALPITPCLVNGSFGLLGSTYEIRIKKENKMEKVYFSHRLT